MLRIRFRFNRGLKNFVVRESLRNQGRHGCSACITPEGYLRLLPGAFHTDGFFVATIKKTG